MAYKGVHSAVMKHLSDLTIKLWTSELKGLSGPQCLKTSQPSDKYRLYRFLIFAPLLTLSGPPGFTCWISFAQVLSFIYCRVLIFALSPFYILIYMF